jgi:hypothetical protein
LDIQATWNNTASPTTCSTIVYASFNLVEEGEQTSIQYRAQNCARKSIRREILQSLTLPTRVPSTHSTSFPGSKSSSVVPPTFRSPTSRSRSHNKCPIIGLFCLALEHSPFLLQGHGCLGAVAACISTKTTRKSGRARGLCCFDFKVLMVFFATACFSPRADRH